MITRKKISSNTKEKGKEIRANHDKKNQQITKQYRNRGKKKKGTRKPS